MLGNQWQESRCGKNKEIHKRAIKEFYYPSSAVIRSYREVSFYLLSTPKIPTPGTIHIYTSYTRSFTEYTKTKPHSLNINLIQVSTGLCVTELGEKHFKSFHYKPFTLQIRNWTPDRIRNQHEISELIDGLSQNPRSLSPCPSPLPSSPWLCNFQCVTSPVEMLVPSGLPQKQWHLHFCELP